MKKILNTKLKDMKAITLVALVITIVVLIILAGVIINITIGNGGIIDRTKTAKEQYQNAQDYEQTEIAKTTNEIDNIVNSRQGNQNTVSAIPSIDYDNGINLTSTLNTDNATYTTQTNGYIYIKGAKSGNNTNGVCEIFVLKGENEVDRFTFQCRTNDGCNFTGHLIVNKGVELKVNVLQNLSSYSIILYPFK